MEYHDSTEFDWKDDSYVNIRKMGLNSIEIQANAAGLLSLADHLVRIANEDHEYVFYDTDPGDLEAGSLTLQITKIDRCGRSLPKG